MTTNRSGAGMRSARWAGGGPGRRLRVSLALVSLAVIGLSQVGCQSDGCSTCGGFGSRLRSNVQALNARLFSREGRGGCKTCGDLGAEPGVIVDGGAVPITSGTVVTPSVITPQGITPLPAPASPALGDDAGQLAPIPSTTTGAHAAPASSRLPAATTGGTTRSAYESNSSRSSNVVLSRRATAPSPAITTDEPDLTSQLPPVDLPIELTRRATPTDTAEPASAPTPAPAAGEGAAAGSPPAASATISIPSLSPPASTPPASTPSGSTPTTAAEPRSAGGLVPATSEIARTASVAPTVLGGSLPTNAGLDWLNAKGYRTLVDLRASSEVDPSFAERVSDHGMLYVALPLSADSLRLNRLSQFNNLLDQADQQPLYFCDTDGRRAGLLWYLHLRSTGGREEQSSAQAKAEEVGFNAALDQARAEEFLKGNFPALASPPSRKTADATPTPRSTPDAPSPITLTLSLAPASVSQLLDPDPPALPLDEPTGAVTRTALTSVGPVGPGQLAPVPASTLAPAALAAAQPALAMETPTVASGAAVTTPPRRSPFDRAAQPAPLAGDRLTSWRPVATLVLSGLGVPLAYWSRTSLFPRRGPRRASLTAKGPGPRKALPGSDA